MAMLWDGKAKEEIIKCIAECKNQSIKSKGYTGIKCRNKIYEKLISEVTQNEGSKKNSIECV